MTPERLAKLKALAASLPLCVVGGDGVLVQAAFALPAVLAELERLAAERDEAARLLAEFRDWQQSVRDKWHRSPRAISADATEFLARLKGEG